ncbi:hypothetical protein DMH15_07440, partial [Streptomyces sp. WAC 06725]
MVTDCWMACAARVSASVSAAVDEANTRRSARPARRAADSPCRGLACTPSSSGGRRGTEMG